MGVIQPEQFNAAVIQVCLAVVRDSWVSRDFSVQRSRCESYRGDVECAGM